MQEYLTHALPGLSHCKHGCVVAKSVCHTHKHMCQVGEHTVILSSSGVVSGEETYAWGSLPCCGRTERITHKVFASLGCDTGKLCGPSDRS